MDFYCSASAMEMPWKFDKAWFFAAFHYMNLGDNKWNNQMDLPKQDKTCTTYTHV